MKRRIFRCLLVLAAITAALTLLEGRFDTWLALYCGVWTFFGLYGMVSMDDDLARERFRPPDQGADAGPLRAIRLTALAHLVLGALDAGRWHLTPIPPAIRAASLATMLIGGVLIIQSIRANRFFSAVVRVQAERGHRVVDNGPYGTIRHPGYLGMIIAMLSSGLALGSWIGFAFAAIYAVLILRRVWFEDAFLKANLEGYRDYASRVTFRLVPGAW